ncbi:MAG: WD40 repeat domain-containing protein [Anaerolineales bacterium]
MDNCRTIHALQGGSPQFSSKGARVARADDDGTVWIWDLGTGELIHRVAAHESLDFNVPVLAISESGEVLGSAGGPESSLVLIDVASGQRIWSSRASADRISSLAFANNDRLLVTGGEDGIVRIWGAQAWSRSD